MSVFSVQSAEIPRVLWRPIVGTHQPGHSFVGRRQKYGGGLRLSRIEQTLSARVDAATAGHYGLATLGLRGLDMFEGFARERIETTGTTINLVRGGTGPPLLLLHGYPQTHVEWHKVAPIFAEQNTVVAPDLRGYGDSGKPPSDDGLVTYCKRTTAYDQVEVMSKLGFDAFHVVGHDRGVRVGHRMALDHPGRVRTLTFPGRGSPPRPRSITWTRACRSPGSTGT